MTQTFFAEAVKKKPLDIFTLCIAIMTDPQKKGNILFILHGEHPKNQLQKTWKKRSYSIHYVFLKMA